MGQAHADPGHTQLRREIAVIWGSVARDWYDISWYHTVGETCLLLSLNSLSLEDHHWLSGVHRERGSNPRESAIWECINLYIIKQFLLFSKPYASPSLILVFAKDSWWIGAQGPESPCTWYQRCIRPSDRYWPWGTSRQMGHRQPHTDACVLAQYISTKHSYDPSSLAEKQQGRATWAEGAMQTPNVKNGENVETSADWWPQKGGTRCGQEITV